MTQAARGDDQSPREDQRGGKCSGAVDPFLQQDKGQDSGQERGDGKDQKCIGGRGVLHGRAPRQHPDRVQPDDQQALSVEPFAPCRQGPGGQKQVAQKQDHA
ncbi:MAG: hypothetical protein U1E69_06460 [Tabrizicola sp.]|nr:hypothetical protein [Tabrizicola sp.]MDZ4086432.1 hypothetical protein [Tabrizicola sp.]